MNRNWGKPEINFNGNWARLLYFVWLGMTPVHIHTSHFHWTWHGAHMDWIHLYCHHLAGIMGDWSQKSRRFYSAGWVRRDWLMLAWLLPKQVMEDGSAVCSRAQVISTSMSQLSSSTHSAGNQLQRHSSPSACFVFLLRLFAWHRVLLIRVMRGLGSEPGSGGA